MARTAEAGRADWTTTHGAGCIQAQVATAAGLDMRECWTATKEGYLGRVPKALILDAVREGAGASAAARIAGTKKEVMAADAAALLAGTGWLAGGAARSGGDISRGLWRSRGPARRAGGDGGGVTRPVPLLPSCPTWAAPAGAVLFRPTRPGRNTAPAGSGAPAG